MTWADDINRFWFEELKPADWFSGDPKVDALIRERFAGLYESLSKQPPSPADLDIDALLAAVIAFDQFPRNLFRQSPQAYATDPLALSLATHAVNAGMDKDIETWRRHFLYMPFQHSEDRATQARSQKLFAALGDKGTLDYAVHHKDIVDRFGRFPHRNAILGRESTPEEIEFLRTHRSFA
jgi:uncharacterized protein (DUF924 family)